jgi:hypothetical protein
MQWRIAPRAASAAVLAQRSIARQALEANCRRQVTITTIAVVTSRTHGLMNQPRAKKPTRRYRRNMQACSTFELSDAATHACPRQRREAVDRVRHGVQDATFQRGCFGWL